MSSVAGSNTSIRRRITPIRSASCSASWRLWVQSRMVRPSARNPAIRLRTSRADAGSSRRSARPERSPAARAAPPGSGRGAASFPWTRWRRGGRAHPTARAAGATARSRRESSPPRGRTGVQTARGWPAADPVVEARRLGEQSHPRPQLGAGPVRLPAARCPRRAVPLDIGSRPSSIRMVVVFPAPLGPRMAQSFPREPKGKIPDRGEAVETAGEVSGFDHGTTAFSRQPSAVSD